MRFTQYLRPAGRPKQVEVDRSPEIEEMALSVVAAGGRFECEVLMTGLVSFTCEHSRWEKEDMGQVAHEICENGPAVHTAVDELVRTAHQRLAVDSSHEGATGNG